MVMVYEQFQTRKLFAPLIYRSEAVFPGKFSRTTPEGWIMRRSAGLLIVKRTSTRSQPTALLTFSVLVKVSRLGGTESEREKKDSGSWAFRFSLLLHPLELVLFFYFFSCHCVTTVTDPVTFHLVKNFHPFLFQNNLNIIIICSPFIIDTMHFCQLCIGLTGRFLTIYICYFVFI